MDNLFEKAPLLVPGSSYAKVGDRHAAERDLREGGAYSPSQFFDTKKQAKLICSAGTFVPGAVTEVAQTGGYSLESAEKQSYDHDVKS